MRHIKAARAEYMALIDKGEEHWRWTGEPMRFAVAEDTYYLVHHLAWFYATGEWPKWKVVVTCGYAECVRPDHLSKPNGERPVAKQDGRTTLTPERVLAIRRAYDGGEGNQKELALRFGIPLTTLHRIVTRKSWTHIL